MKTFEYAGFRYEVRETASGTTLIPLPGQHTAAYRERHCRAAREVYLAGYDTDENIVEE